MDIDELASTYVHVLRSARISSLFDDILHYTPDLAWAVMEAVAERLQTQGGSPDLFAWVLGKYLGHHGQAVADRVLQEAKVNAFYHGNLLLACEKEPKKIPQTLLEDLRRLDPPAYERMPDQPLHPGLYEVADGMLTYQTTFWAEDQLIRLVKKDPEKAWAAMEKVLDEPLTDGQISDLADGPLSFLVKKHGAVFVDRIKASAAVTPQMARCVEHMHLDNSDEYN